MNIIFLLLRHISVLGWMAGPVARRSRGRVTICRYRIAFACAVGLIGAGLSAGCGRGNAPDLAKVTGTVTRNSKPVPDLLVHFTPDEGRPSWGLTDARGRFKLYYAPEEDGARLGEHTVHVEINRAQPRSFAGDGSVQPDQGAEMEASVDDATATTDTAPGAAASSEAGFSAEELKAIIDKYGKPDKSPLRVRIEKSGPIEIKLD